MDGGWSELVKAHDLKVGYFLVFKKLNTRSLKVIIFITINARLGSGVQVITHCRWISCRKNTGYHATDPKIRTQGAERGRSWIATKHGDGSLKSSNAQRTAERDAELYLGSGPSW
jgi:hypothetical protein